MPDIIMILWLPVTIAAMAVAWVLTLGLAGGPIGEQRSLPVATEESSA